MTNDVTDGSVLTIRLWEIFKTEPLLRIVIVCEIY